MKLGLLRDLRFSLGSQTVRVQSLRLCRIEPRLYEGYELVAVPLRSGWPPRLRSRKPSDIRKRPFDAAPGLWVEKPLALLIVDVLSDSKDTAEMRRELDDLGWVECCKVGNALNPQFGQIWVL